MFGSPGSYRIDGHEFVPSTFVGSFECRACGQEFSEDLLAKAAATGLTGLLPLCKVRTKTFRPAAPPDRARCPLCERELSAYLDFYTGRDPVLKELCRDCRHQRQKELDVFATLLP